MTRFLAIAAVAAALMGGASVASAETCMVKEQIPVPCEGNTRYAPGPVYGAPVYRAPVYQAPVYGGPVYSDYYYDDGYYGGYNDNYYYPSYGANYGPSISFGFGFDGGRHHHGNFRRWHHRHH
jgi:hypothetical protein